MSAAEHLREAIDVGCTRDDHDHIADHRAEVLREAADLIEAWQHDADDAAALDHGALTDTETAAHIAVHRMARRLREMAGKDTGGAAQARVGESTQPAPDFYRPGHTYTDPNPAEHDWQFRCVTVTTNPGTGERTALGWIWGLDGWEPCAYAADDWELHLHVGTVEHPTEGGTR
jgi:hypothetical protein